MWSADCVFFSALMDGRAFDYFERAVLGEPHLRKAKKGSKDFYANSLREVSSNRLLRWCLLKSPKRGGRNRHVRVLVFWVFTATYVQDPFFTVTFEGARGHRSRLMAAEKAEGPPR